MKELLYPFDSSYLLKNRKKIRRELLENNTERIHKKIAVLGGSTTNDIVSMLDLFLLDNGIECEFYQSEYAQYWQDAMFGNEKLNAFHPDIIYIHTTSRNLDEFSFDMSLNESDIDDMLEKQYYHFKSMWERLNEIYDCPIIQNNFELPQYRTLGNRDSWDIHGRINFISRLNMKLYEYASSHDSFYINDINYISSSYGLDKWAEPKYWYMYKYAMSMHAIPDFAFNLSNIIKSIFGKNKKAFALDLDNTLWGGVIGDDSVEGIEIGHETADGEAYLAFQKYIKEQTQLGILMTVCSKNDEENAVSGLNHPDGVLKPDDFAAFKANWNPKDINVSDIAGELNILPESIVFVDDNPAEREIVSRQIGCAAPEMSSPDEYIKTIDKNGFFEVTSFSADDMSRNDMYKANAKRRLAQAEFADYDDYLRNMDMTAIIEDFRPIYIQRITQLINKSNQFNLTTRRYTQSEIEEIYNSSDYIRLYGRLYDKFGDNGIVSVIIGKIKGTELHIDLWIMSCRVLKRNMEYAMLDVLAEECRRKILESIFGYYYRTKKNNMVSGLYNDFGFENISVSDNGDSIWKLDLNEYTQKNNIIKLKEGEKI
ncbi:HAD-IIIC family phosphatase [Porcipelethomonas sp.]|uniref:HAD-IIIC family phosphatase n=1 Tax=Porcipelethomonas sp. TaxID=2981675 RepID=UPI003EF9830C